MQLFYVKTGAFINAYIQDVEYYQKPPLETFLHTRLFA